MNQNSEKKDQKIRQHYNLRIGSKNFQQQQFKKGKKRERREHKKCHNTKDWKQGVANITQEKSLEPTETQQKRI